MQTTRKRVLQDENDSHYSHITRPEKRAATAQRSVLRQSVFKILLYLNIQQKSLNNASNTSNTHAAINKPVLANSVRGFKRNFNAENRTSTNQV
jgi:CRISPR/Cas system endoribonuclease Cas6 (RAMP superfamily)